MPGNVNMPGSGKPTLQVSHDVVYIQDSTGSQQPYINIARQFVRTNVATILKPEFKARYAKVRFRVVAFRDHREQGDKWIVQNANPFVEDAGALEAQMAALEASGGGDGPEAQIDALDAGLHSNFGQNAMKLFFLITDSPPHGIGIPGDVIPASHPDALTQAVILKNLQARKVILSVVGCQPTIGYYKGRDGKPLAVDWYTDFARKTGGKFIPIANVTRNPTAMNNAFVGAVLHGGDSLALVEKHGDYIIGESYRGRSALVDTLHSKLSAEGEQCHELHCTDDHNVSYSHGPISRARVDEIVGKALRHQELFMTEDQSDLMSSLLGPG
ncbi:hypothetical protein GGX14DRAFT_468239 [Mycena pura]|uniref:VWFA domain-containing protein n=1 Tax=Mycena pura TaxID=153505 RepID=A0AAD6V4C6_9AGAR|nr:hypothetical protein GGX14DRAFT_468239 [Mycena pura]